MQIDKNYILHTTGQRQQMSWNRGFTHVLSWPLCHHSRFTDPPSSGSLCQHTESDIRINMFSRSLSPTTYVGNQEHNPSSRQNTLEISQKSWKFLRRKEQCNLCQIHEYFIDHIQIADGEEWWNECERM